MTANDAVPPEKLSDASTDVLGLLPHRYPFLLLDRVTVLEPGRRATGVKLVTSSEWFFGESSLAEMVMPNGLIVEALAQLSAALLVDVRDGVTGPMVGYFMAVDRVRYRGGARPGDAIELSVELLRFRRGILRTRGEARVSGQRIVRAELTTVLRPAPSGMLQAAAEPTGAGE